MACPHYSWQLTLKKKKKKEKKIHAASDWIVLKQGDESREKVSFYFSSRGNKTSKKIINKFANTFLVDVGCFILKSENM